MLTPSEMRLAALVEVERRVDNLYNYRAARHGADDGWTIGIEGAAAEMAFAKMIGVFWSGAVGNLKAKDVGLLQVRSTQRDDGCLILHKWDSDDDVFVLMVGTAPRFDCRGWLRAADGKTEEFWRDPIGGRPAYFVPQSKLRLYRKAHAKMDAALGKPGPY